MSRRTKSSRATGSPAATDPFSRFFRGVAVTLARVDAGASQGPGGKRSWRQVAHSLIFYVEGRERGVTSHVGRQGASSALETVGGMRVWRSKFDSVSGKRSPYMEAQRWGTSFRSDRLSS